VLRQSEMIGRLWPRGDVVGLGEWEANERHIDAMCHSTALQPHTQPTERPACPKSAPSHTTSVDDLKKAIAEPFEHVGPPHEGRTSENSYIRFISVFS